MEKDFRIGLIAGLVFAIGALIWVATRPGLRPQRRLHESALPPSSYVPSPPETTDTPSPNQTLPPGLIPAEPQQPLAPAIVSLEPVISAPEPMNEPRVPDLTIYEQQEKIQTTKFHIVQRNESLSSISKLYYDSPNRWQKILDANRETIKDPNKITPGTKLIIPD